MNNNMDLSGKVRINPIIQHLGAGSSARNLLTMTVRAITEQARITQTAEGTESSPVTLSVLNTSHPFYIRALTCLLKPTALLSVPHDFKEVEYHTTFRWLIATNKN